MLVRVVLETNTNSPSPLPGRPQEADLSLLVSLRQLLSQPQSGPASNTPTQLRLMPPNPWSRPFFRGTDYLGLPSSPAAPEMQPSLTRHGTEANVGISPTATQSKGLSILWAFCLLLKE